MPARSKPEIIRSMFAEWYLIASSAIVFEKKMP